MSKEIRTSKFSEIKRRYEVQADNHNTKLCLICLKDLDVENFYLRTVKGVVYKSSYCKLCDNKKSRDYSLVHRKKVYKLRKKRYWKNPEKYRIYRNENSRKHRILNKEIVFKHYGGVECVCCKENIIDFLTIDHINGGGTKHRKELNLLGSDFYRWLIKNNFPEGYQVLCFNCNQGREMNKKSKERICPHKLYEIKK